MKPSKAFYATLEFIATGINKIFSLGNDEIAHHTLLIPFYILGKIAKYIIGYPLGAFLGGLAAIAVSFINLFEAEIEQDTDEEEFNEETTDNLQQEQPAEDINRMRHFSIANDNFQEVNEFSENAQNKQFTESVEKNAAVEKIKHSALLNKKYHLEHKSTLLAQFIDEKIALLIPNSSQYQKALNRYIHLESELGSQQFIAENAKTFSHNETTAEHKIFRPIGIGVGDFRPVITAVFVPDHDARSRAKQQCLSIKQQLESVSEELTINLADYKKESALTQIKNKLNRFHFDLNNLDNEQALNSLLEQYKEILNFLETFGFDEFSINTYLPKSEYSELFLARKMMEQLGRQHGFFKSLPDELKEKIAISAISSNLPEEETRALLKDCAFI